MMSYVSFVGFKSSACFGAPQWGHVLSLIPTICPQNRQGTGSKVEPQIGHQEYSGETGLPQCQQTNHGFGSSFGSFSPSTGWAPAITRADKIELE